MAKKKEKLEKKSSYSQLLAEKAKKKQEAERLRREEEERLNRQRCYREKVAGAQKDGTLRTSLAKLAGIKSTFCLDEDTLLVTSFGRGNEAVLEHRIEGENIRELCEKPTLHIDPAEKKQFPVSGRTVNGIYPVGYIQDTRTRGQKTRPPYAVEQKNRKKQWVEEHFFGRTCSDNIHVQMAYCILDIKKVLAFHVNDIVYALNNLGGQGGNQDLVGTIPATTEYEKFSNPQTPGNEKRYRDFQSFAKNPRLGYFGEIFTPPEGEEREYNTYQILAVLSIVRNFCAHHQNYGFDSLYNLTTQGNADARKELLDRVYRDKIISLHKNFAEHSYVNLAILKKLPAFEKLSWEELAGSYYRYTMEKEYKNLGFSIKKLREKLVILNPEWKEQRFDTVRGKFYQLMDFVLSSYYMSEANRPLCEDMVDELRRCLTDQEKDGIYDVAARKLWEERGDSLRKLADNMNGTTLKDLGEKYGKSADESLIPERKRMKEGIQAVKMDEEICVEGNPDADQFCKAIYFLTRFLDGKEINDLLTTLIHQFENIAGFLQVLEQSGLIRSRAEIFKENYQIFRDSKAIAAALHRINGFARMSRETAAAKRYMYVDASRILGVNASEEELIQEWTILFESGREERARNRHANGFRNFIANNVVDSDRFRYLVRYTDLTSVCKLIEKESVLRFILNRIPEDQINRYHASCGLNRNASLKIKREDLLKRIQGFSLEELQSVVNTLNLAAGANSEDGRKKQELITLTSLYLTVLYLVSKNLVLINARYFMAFYLLELDMVIYRNWMKDKLKQSREYLELSYKLSETKLVKGQKKQEFDKRALTAVWIAEGVAHETQWYENSQKRASEGHKHGRRMRPLNYLGENLRSNLVEISQFNTFRNQVEHLNFVRSGYNLLEDRPEIPINSYFQLYHYIVQKALKLNSPHLEKGTYSKDCLKVLCVPFGYSLPRYKNLTIEDLFDKNETLGEGTPTQTT